jgi:hypothetical protein
MKTFVKAPRLASAALASTALVAVAFAAPAAAEKWDMPLAYSASNFHSENAAVFAACVTEGTGGDIEIVTHPGGSLFGGADIKRAIQTGQVQIGERLLSATPTKTRCSASTAFPSSPPPSTIPSSCGRRPKRLSARHWMGRTW